MRVLYAAALVVGTAMIGASPAASAPLTFEFGLSGWPGRACSMQENYSPPNCAPTGIFARPNAEGIPMAFTIDGTITFGGPPGTSRSKATITFEDGSRVKLKDKWGSAGLYAQHLDESIQGPGMVTLADLSFNAGGLSGHLYLEEYYGTPQCPPHSLVKSRPSEDAECETEVANTIEELSFIDFEAPIDAHDTYAIVDAPDGSSTGQIEMRYFRRVAVPEPAMLTLLALGGVAAAYRKRR